jgi:hypothetical protein
LPSGRSVEVFGTLEKVLGIHQKVSVFDALCLILNVVFRKRFMRLVDINVHYSCPDLRLKRN